MTAQPTPATVIPWIAKETAATLAKREETTAKRAHKRADNWIHPQERMETARRVVSAVIRRIEFPKRGEPFALSKTDKADAMQAGLCACVESRFFEHGFLRLPVFRAVRNAIQGPACLRLRKGIRETPCGDAITETADAAGLFTAEETVSARLTPAQVEIARAMMDTLRAARTCDLSRKSAQNFRSHRGFFLLVLATLTGRQGRALSPGAFDTRKHRFLEYLATGAKHQRATRTARPIASPMQAQALAHAMSALF